MKAAEIEVKALFDLSHSMAGEFLAKFRYPYEALPELGAWIAAVGPQLSSDEYEKRGEQIWIHKSAKVAPSVSLTGPLIVCANAELRHCAYFRGNVLIGAGSVVTHDIPADSLAVGNPCRVIRPLEAGEDATHSL